MAAKRNPEGAAGRLRIIGGRWRGRKIGFPPVGGLRPTPDRVRETLFNWLQGEVDGARCLDLYAGSGALGFEALSRGAGSVLAVERSARVADHLQKLARQLVQDGSYQLRQEDALQVAGQRWSVPFELIFCDPPFDQNPWPALLQRLPAGGAAAAGTLLYAETATPLVPGGSSGWQIHRQGRAGRVHYALLRRCHASAAQGGSQVAMDSVKHRPAGIHPVT